ncbi:hypothetical protein ASPCAL07744 [Aspergillus calidoustus]|jgi:hypothetical protein|uniref:SnoaL-like domain-containing protein n=1 Tax=Aspergillus calidoustus TaxID=454130 RepID=A0A0U5GNF1_ASPCI|nr:hypothetical protein ASPCAL07744 [Aspergillus calidoustus]
MSSTRLLTAQKYISHFTNLDKDLLASLLSEAYTHEFAPTSLNPPGPFTKTGFLAHGASLSEIMTGFPVTAKEYFECEGSNRVVVWATSEPHFREEVMDGDEEEWRYRGEYVFMFWMDESGDRIERTVEFLDSAATKDRLFGLMARARANLEKVKST